VRARGEDDTEVRGARGPFALPLEERDRLSRRQARLRLGLLALAAVIGLGVPTWVVLRVGARTSHARSFVEAFRSSGEAPLARAALAGNVEDVARLLDGGMDPNTRSDTGETALYWAAFAGTERCARLLLDRGADPNLGNANGYTPLHAAAAEDQVRVVRLLLERGADRESRAEDGSTPRDLAQRNGHRGIAGML
jgi:ankyrin repeat protein